MNETHCVYENLLLQYGHLLLQILLCPLQESIMALLHVLHVLLDMKKLQFDVRIQARDKYISVVSAVHTMFLIIPHNDTCHQENGRNHLDKHLIQLSDLLQLLVLHHSGLLQNLQLLSEQTLQTGNIMNANATEHHI